MEQTIIRPATPADAGRLLEIYAYYVQHTAVSFEYEVPSLTEFEGRIRHTLTRYPYLVIQEGERILGYAYAGAFHPRAAFAWACEMTIYLDPAAHKKGLGRKLYEALEAELQRLGFLNLYACIACPEAEDEYLTNNSPAFHAHMGYVEIGRFHHCGYKFGRWYHMIWMEKLIGSHENGAALKVPAAWKPT